MTVLTPKFNYSAHVPSVPHTLLIRKQGKFKAAFLYDIPQPPVCTVLCDCDQPIREESLCCA